VLEYLARLDLTVRPGRQGDLDLLARLDLPAHRDLLALRDRLEPLDPWDHPGPTDCLVPRDPRELVEWRDSLECPVVRE